MRGSEELMDNSSATHNAPDVFGDMDPRIAGALLTVPGVYRAFEAVHAERYLELTHTRWHSDLDGQTQLTIGEVWIPARLLHAVRTVRMETYAYECLDGYAVGEETTTAVQAELDYLVELLDGNAAGIYTPWVVEAVDELYAADYRYAMGRNFTDSPEADRGTLHIADDLNPMAAIVGNTLAAEWTTPAAMEHAGQIAELAREVMNGAPAYDRLDQIRSLVADAVVPWEAELGRDKREGGRS